MGPHIESEGAANLGKACHILSASENGPRGRGGKDAAYIGSESNGIWCCAYHADLVDKNKGRNYPTDTLHAWKDLAEARTRKQMDGMPSPLGWVDSVEVLSFPFMRRPLKLELSRFTLLAGIEASGKSVLLEMAAGVSDSETLERFANRKPLTHRPQAITASVRITYSTVDTIDKHVDVLVKGSEFERIESRLPCLLPPGDIEVVYCGTRDSYRRDDEDDLDFITRVLKVDKGAAYAFVKAIDPRLAPGSAFFSIAEDTDDEDDSRVISRKKKDGRQFVELVVRHLENGADIPLDALSGTEHARVIIALFVAKAAQISRHRLTMMVIDEFTSGLDGYNFSRLLNTVSRQSFQAIVVVPYSCIADVVDKSGAKHKLMNHEHLKPWTLRWLGSRLWHED
jgi:energy-coupling factor transporter ATP-binding protein EcfA2